MKTPSLPLRVDDRTIGLYLQEISRYKPLSASEEFALAAGIRKGDFGALEKLIKANLRFVVSVARNYQHQGLSLCDLINEGNLGLVKAAKRFDEKKNFKFISYAVWWIRQAILQALADYSRILRIPVNRVSTIHHLGKTRARLEQRFRRTPNTTEVAREMGISERTAAHAAHVAIRHASLDAPVGWNGCEALGTLISDQQCELPDGCIGRSATNTQVERVLQHLSLRERRVVSLYFGIGEETNHTLDEIGARLNITRERVRQIKERAMQRLRRSARKGALQRHDLD